MRRVLGELSGAVYDDLERVLTLRHRGCLGIRPKKDTLDNLHQMKLGMDRAEKLIARERVGYSNTWCVMLCLNIVLFVNILNNGFA